MITIITKGSRVLSCSASKPMKKGKDTAAKEKSLCYMDTPIGRIAIAEDGTGISDLIFAPSGVPLIPALSEATLRETPLLRKAVTQLREYFQGERKIFDLPLSYWGTDFQMDDWQALLTIPYGQTRSYKEIAVQIGRPKAYRAVGLANNRNPISIIVPCHRVIGHDGAMVGYGSGIPMKEYLLKLEREHA